MGCIVHGAVRTGARQCGRWGLTRAGQTPLGPKQPRPALRARVVLHGSRACSCLSPAVSAPTPPPKTPPVYTHGEMLPAHAYPKLKAHKHLAGHFGTAWQQQKVGGRGLGRRGFWVGGDEGSLGRNKAQLAARDPGLIIQPLPPLPQTTRSASLRSSPAPVRICPWRRAALFARALCVLRVLRTPLPAQQLPPFNCSTI
jgi:hypothetical protein